MAIFPKCKRIARVIGQKVRAGKGRWPPCPIFSRDAGLQRLGRLAASSAICGPPELQASPTGRYEIREKAQSHLEAYLGVGGDSCNRNNAARAALPPCA